MYLSIYLSIIFATPFIDFVKCSSNIDLPPPPPFSVYEKRKCEEQNAKEAEVK
jgi:hypothetical protein